VLEFLKELVVGMVGGALAGAVIGVLMNRAVRRRQVQRAGDHSVQVQIGKREAR